jgi:hypothetical protein
MTTIYVSLLVYDYDRSPRGHRIRHFCKTLEEAQHLVHRLEQLTGNGLLRPWLGKTGGVGSKDTTESTTDLSKRSRESSKKKLSKSVKIFWTNP